MQNSCLRLSDGIISGTLLNQKQEKKKSITMKRTSLVDRYNKHASQGIDASLTT